MSLDVNLRKPNKDRMEKCALREAFDELNIIPQEVLWRQKNAFSDSVSKEEDSWYLTVQKYIDTIVSDDEFENNKKHYTFCEPKTKEAYYYRKKFREYFGERDVVIPYYWMPKWTEETNDPSARTLKIYKND